jgi:hypothetical protein
VLKHTNSATKVVAGRVSRRLRKWLFHDSLPPYEDPLVCRKG